MHYSIFGLPNIVCAFAQAKNNGMLIMGAFITEFPVYDSIDTYIESLCAQPRGGTRQNLASHAR